MKCFYHPANDAAGMCPQCGRAACHECLKDVGNGILCKGCIAEQLRTVEAERQEAFQEQKESVAKARSRIRTSRVVFTIFFAVGLLETIIMLVGSQFHGPNATGLFSVIIGGGFAAVFMGYVAWSFYWGFPAIWNGLRRTLSNTGCFVILNPITWLIFFFIFLMVVGCFGEMYCIFGGGWYQYSKRARLVRDEVGTTGA